MTQFTEKALCQENEHVFFTRTKLSLHDFARNDLYYKTVGDWLVMLDTDISFDPDVVARLVMVATRYDLPVLVGTYSFKTPPHGPVVFAFNKEHERHERIVRWDRDSDVFQVDAAGGGLMFVRKRIMDEMSQKFGCGPFDRIGTMGEDFSFAARLRTMGLKMYCAWKIEAEHLHYLGLAPSTAFGGVHENVPVNEYGMEAFRAAQ